jgi:protein phosphatase
MILSIDAFSDVGCVREHNEDMILVQGELICHAQIQLQVEPAPDSPFVVAVADGMGGHNGGEFASELAVQSLDDFVHDLTNGLSFEELKSAFDSWIQQIHNFVVNKGNELPEFKNMGTTLVGLLVYEIAYFGLMWATADCIVSVVEYFLKFRPIIPCVKCTTLLLHRI